MNTWKVILATMLIFGTGVITGGLLVHYAIPNAAVRSRMVGPPRLGPASPGGSRLEFLRRMQRELDLTPEQRAQVDKILKDSQERSRKIMEPVAPVLHEEVKRTKEEFRQALTPEQRGRFDELMKHQQQRSRESHHLTGSRPEPAPSTNSP